MKKLSMLLVLAVLTSLLTLSPGATSAPAAEPGLQMYTATVSPEAASDIVRDGYDVADQTPRGDQVELDMVLSEGERRKLAAQGVDVELWRNRDGLTSAQLARSQAADGYKVWRPFEGPGGMKQFIKGVAKKYSDIVDLKKIGTSRRGRPILALKVTKNARQVPDGKRPAVLYWSLLHAREWITGEVTRRTLMWFLRNYDNNPLAQRLVNKRELWFVLVANPDGYQYTFDKERLWRKNLRDNDGDGKITIADGVDLNRNFSEHWGYDNEGSAPIESDQTYRGPSPASEPETRAMQGLLRGLRPEANISYHSYGPLLLYPFGWQQDTPTDDDPIYKALSGTDEKPAIKGYNPGLGAELYITNGDANDFGYAIANSLSWTPELGEGTPGNGFEFPDSPKKVQKEFRLNLPFALDVAKSAANFANPKSHLGNKVHPFYMDRFSKSYGTPQKVEVNAKRNLGQVSVKYQINSGKVRTTSTHEYAGGERYGDKRGRYFHRLRGTITGTSVGDRVKVWFKGGGKKSKAFTYRVVKDSGDEVLILSAEDYTGASNFPAYTQTEEPSFLSYYTDALAENGIASDVYDVDANGRKAPHPLGVLDHYKAVVWYTGNDVITREVGMVPGTASKLAQTEQMAVRDFINEGGRLLFTGKYAGDQYYNLLYEYDPVNNEACNPEDAGEDGCIPLVDDFFQYYLGGYFYNESAGYNEATEKPYDVVGTDEPLGGKQWEFGPPSAGNQDDAGSMLATSGILPREKFPQFDSWASAVYDRAGGPFEPHTGNHYVYSQIADVSYKRLTKTVTVPAGGGTFNFWTSYNTEGDWDYLFVEARHPGQQDWTTLPDANGHTSTSTGDSCPEGWGEELHPRLHHYQTRTVPGGDAAPTCTPTGTTGEWNAASGSSGGWEEWEIDLADYAGEEVELSVTYASDWSTQGLGVFLDDFSFTFGGAGNTTSFEEDLGGWTVPGAPNSASAPNPNDWTRTTAAGFPEGAAITTEDSVWFGFGFEGIAGEEKRASIMKRVMDYLLR